MVKSDLKKLRQKIDRLDKSLIKLLQDRFYVISKIGKYKKEQDMGLIDPGREKEMLIDRKRWAKQKGINENFLRKLFTLIIREGKETQKKIIEKK